MKAAADALGRSFGSGVRQLREAQGWSQEQLAEQAGLNRSYVGEVERGDVSVSLTTVAKLAHAFGLAPSALVGHAENSVVA
jgi:XRE family transcriptional regulator, regulator of sulfur utilization